MLSSVALVTALAARPLLAAEYRQTYAEAIQADPDLSGYWRFDSDLLDVQGKSNADGGASASFVKGGVADAKPLPLGPVDSAVK